MKRVAARHEQLTPSSAIAPETDPITDGTTDVAANTRTDTRATTARQSVTIMLAGKEYRLRSDASEASLQQVASYVDRSMVKIRERTDTVDSLDIALLTALNLAREVLTLRGRADAESETRSSALDDVSDGQLRSLIEQVESELPSAETGRSG